MLYPMISAILWACPGERSAFLSFKKGDLIRLDNEDGQDVMSSGWCSGICERTGEKGDFPAECVYVLPAITRPPPEVLVGAQQLLATYCNFALGHVSTMVLSLSLASSLLL